MFDAIIRQNTINLRPNFVGMNVDNYFEQGKRWWFRLHEKGGKRHGAPAHHNAETYVDAYLAAAQIAEDRKGPHTTCCHTFRATGITTYLQNGGTIEHAQQIANHESPRTLARLPAAGRATKLYDRTSDAISLDEIERITI